MTGRRDEMSSGFKTVDTDYPNNTARRCRACSEKIKDQTQLVRDGTDERYHHGCVYADGSVYEEVL